MYIRRGMTPSIPDPAPPGEPPAPTSPKAAPRAALIALLLGPLAFSTGAFVFGGLLSPMARDLAVSVNAVAQLQTAFAVACALGGPALALASRALDRKALLIAVLLVLAAVHAGSALAPSYEVLLALRLLGGFVGALTVPLASTLAVALVPPELRGRALAVVAAGTALGLLIGIPVGSLVGAAFGWSAALWYTAGLSLLVAGSVAILVPPRAAPAAAAGGGGAAAALSRPLASLYLATLLAFAATFASIGLIGPIVTRLTGLTGGAVGLMQILIGIGSLLGLVLGARLADGVGRRALAPLFCAIAATQVLFAAGLSWAPPGLAGGLVFALAALPGAAALFASLPVVAADIARRAGGAATLAFALNGAMIFLGQGLGIGLGGAGFSALGLPGAAAAGAALATIGAVAAARLKA
ncbi:MAG: MFS transporter [Pseudomonadota bacterium]